MKRSKFIKNISSKSNSIVLCVIVVVVVVVVVVGVVAQWQNNDFIISKSRVRALLPKLAPKMGEKGLGKEVGLTRTAVAGAAV